MARRSALQREKDLERTAELYLRGVYQTDIAAQLGVTQQTVSKDIKALQTRWQESALTNIDEMKSRELARIDELERTYWAEWEASKEERSSTTTKAVEHIGNKSQRNEATIRKEERLGDPAYLRGVQWCIERRCAIVGIDAPKRNESKTNLSGELELTHSVDPEQYNRAIGSLIDALGMCIPGTGDQRDG